MAWCNGVDNIQSFPAGYRNINVMHRSFGGNVFGNHSDLVTRFCWTASSYPEDPKSQYPSSATVLKSWEDVVKCLCAFIFTQMALSTRMERNHLPKYWLALKWCIKAYYLSFAIPSKMELHNYIIELGILSVLFIWNISPTEIKKKVLLVETGRTPIIPINSNTQRYYSDGGRTAFSPCPSYR